MALSVCVIVDEPRGQLTTEWISKLCHRSRMLVVGSGSDPVTDVGPLITREAVTRAKDAITTSLLQGGIIELDGRTVEVQTHQLGNFLGPTIMSNVSPDMPIYEEELFAPVLSVIRVDTLSEAIALINANPYGNGASIFTTSGANARKFQFEIEAGQVGVNVPIPVPLPFFSWTGNKGSSLGDLGFYGKSAISFFTETKTVVSKWSIHDASETKPDGTMPRH